MKKFAVILSFATLTSSVLGMNNIPQNIKGVMGISAEGWAQPAIVGFGTRTPGSSHIIFENPEKEKIFSQLVILATDGDIVEFKSLLENHLDLKESSDVKNPLLLFAVSGGQYEIVRWLIENGADIKTKDTKKNTPLILAFSRGHTDLMRFLMNHILSKESTESAAEMITDVVKAAPNDVCDKVKKDISTLIYDFVRQKFYNNVYITQEGLIRGQRRTDSDSRNTAISTIFARNQAESNEIARSLTGFIQKGDVKKLEGLLEKHREINPNLILSIAAEKCQLSVVKYAISLGASANVVDSKGTTPLMLASINGNFKILKYLIDQGAKVNEKNEQDYTALIFATKNNRTDIAKYLIEHGADVNVVSGDQDTPIMWASKHNNFEVVKLLLKHGAKESINVANKEGVTTAIWVASNNNLEMLRLLVENGVNINKRDNRGYVPMDFALQNDNEEMMLFLIESGLKFEEKLAITKEPPLIWFAYKNNLKLVKILVEKGAKVNVKSSVGDTPLMFAVNNNNYEMVQYLVNHGAEVTAKNNDGDTLIQIAGRNRNRRIVQLLLEHIGQAPAA